MSKFFEEQTGPVTPKEALKIAHRFNNSHWRGRGADGETARYSIPANPQRDDDIRLGAFIEHAERLLVVAEQILAEGVTTSRRAELMAAVADLKETVR